MLRGNQRASRAAGAPCFNPCSTTNLTGATANSMTVPRSPHRGPRKLLSLVGHLALVLSLFGTAVTAAIPAFADSIVTPGALQLTQISNGPAVVGKPLSFTISTTNTTNGPINGVLLGGSLPVGMPVAGILGPGGNPDLCARGGNAFSCSMGDLAPGASATASFSGTPTVAVTRVTVLAAATGCQGSPLPGGLNCATTGGHFVTTTSTLSLPVQTIAPPPGPITVPIAATSVHAIAGNAQATVTWVPPLSNGGSLIASYLVTSNPPGGTATVTAPATIATLTGLTNGTSYTFTVTPRSAAGAGLTSAPSNSVTPTAPVVLTAPGAPTGVTATAGNASASVSWTAPLSDGGSAITSYTVSAATANGVAPATPISATVTAPATSATLASLDNGTAYTFTVVATNAVGNSASSLPSNSVTPVAPAPVPGAPTAVTAKAGNASATVSWTAPLSDGGSAITSYTVTSSPAGASLTVAAPATSATLTGLTNGTAYTLTVVATNAVGNSAPPAPSDRVTPVAPATVPGAPTAVSATAGNASASVSWTAPASNGGSAITSYTVSVATANGAAPATLISTTVAAPATSATL